MIRVFCILLITAQLSSYAQQPWASNTKLRFTASTSYFLCDLGGKDAVGTNDFTDLNLEQTRYAFGFGIQYYYNQFSIGANGFYARLAADDRLTNAGRSIRQLHVLTNVAELSVNAEYCLPPEAYFLRNFYFNVGIGIMIYQPQARYNGTLVNLRPLGTEGQNYLPNKKPYGILSPVVPFGFGYKFIFPNSSSLSIDMSLRKSFTDYLDDVSTVYADPEIIGQQSGEVAAYLADPSINGRKTGSQRGDPKDNDQYFLIGFRYEIPIKLSNSYKLNTRCAFHNKTYKYGKQNSYSKRRLRRLRLFR